LNFISSATDIGIGYGLESAEANTANLIASHNIGESPSKVKRQLDKIANSAAALLNTAGLAVPASMVKTLGDNLDAAMTDGSANLGEMLRLWRRRRPLRILVVLCPSCTIDLIACWGVSMHDTARLDPRTAKVFGIMSSIEQLENT
jgi:hypothetical protein